MKVIYSNCTGSYLVEKEIADSILFDKENTVEKCLRLEKGEILDEERELMNKYPGAELLRKIDDTKKINEVLSLFSEKSADFFEIELKLAKKKIKESTGFDNFLINASDCVEELARYVNMLSRRLREWYELANPELSRSIEDNARFAKKILENPERGENSMGADLEERDFEAIKELASQIASLNETKKKQQEYIETLMKKNCPNLQAVAGSLLGAKLIALAGSFQKLAVMSASTIQVLGAEKALFRHVRTGAKSPKHGVIIQHPLVHDSKNKGLASRQVADKISIAARIDFFGGEFAGEEIFEKLRKKLVEKNNQNVS